ncbi:hypothetical protein GCM10011415_32680 [Salipiger pallidus]|uniref:Uncharacterized protein n=1 Tax=Salipiger pallidus TaxID=1775170 RepID=A0A8J3EHU1_9RHOB|nr:hypothetical protein GCM10011415_32680 [Salipiger pallidus]
MLSAAGRLGTWLTGTEEAGWIGMSRSFREGLVYRITNAMEVPPAFASALAFRRYRRIPARVVGIGGTAIRCRSCIARRGDE